MSLPTRNQISKFPAFLGDVEGFVHNLIDCLTKDGINVSELELDHICYRVQTEDVYAQYQKKLLRLEHYLLKQKSQED